MSHQKVVFSDEKGRLSYNPNGQFLMVGTPSDFEVDLKAGLISHRMYTMWWKTPVITTWSIFLQDISIAIHDDEPMEGSNIVPAAYPGEGKAMAAMRDNKVFASILLVNAPQDRTNFPYRTWKMKVIEELSKHGDVWVGQVKNQVFTKNIRANEQSIF